MQDVLGLGAESRMNTPGTAAGNWVWRLLPGSGGRADGRAPARARRRRPAAHKNEKGADTVIGVRSFSMDLR
ncbi:MAG: 4-alpha-glucanotransferase [Oscillospiraceae bacterium]